MLNSLLALEPAFSTLITEPSLLSFSAALFLISYQDVMPWDNYAAIIRKSDGGGTAHSVSMQQGNMMQWTNQNWIKVLNTTDFIL